MKPTFIQVTEIWIPSRDRQRLEFAGGIDGGHAGFNAAIDPEGYGFGEGLPGRAWSERRPIILDDLQGTPWFRRVEAARAAGLTAGLAYPVFAGDCLLAVVTFFCSDNEENVGAIELWRNEGRLAEGMRLLEGHFGILESFRYMASHNTFMRGFGLPGIVWESGLPVLLADLGNSKRFVRRDDARRVGIHTGLGLPCHSDPGKTYVLNFLSALGTPIARRFEVWVVDHAVGGLVLKEGLCDTHAAYADALVGVVLQPGEGLLGQVMRSGLPAISLAIGSDPTPVGEMAGAAGLDRVLALPILRAGGLTAVVVLYF